MTNDKKNINQLVSDDDDPTAELEVLFLGEAPSQRDEDDMSESAANTYDFVGKNKDHDISITDLKSDLKTRSETINRLQYDIEQLRARWTGLETEIKAREELTHNLNQDLDDTKKRLARKEKLIEKRDQSIKALKAELRDRDDKHGELNASITEREEQIERLQDELASYKKSTEAESEQHLIARQQQTGQIAGAQTLMKEQQTRIEHTESYADSLRQKLQDFMTARSEAEDTRESLELNLDHAAGQLEERNAEFAELERIKTALAKELEGRKDAYAEEIGAVRFELGEAQESLAEQELVARQLEELEALLAEERNSNAESGKELDGLKAAHAEEIRMIRLELGEAQETVAQNTLITEELASDLIDTRGFRDELEQMLNKSTEEGKSRIEQMEKENRKLLREVAENEEKLATKSEAINCLLAELAKKSEQIGSIGEIEEVIHEIDDRMSERIDERSGKERERVTRVLIGSIDGQELRFPLFKDRQTIGRTEQNDIQLKASYVSRRHAVIVTERDRARVIDWGSKNGVFVNSKRVTEHFLQNGDIITIGTADFRYEERPKHHA